jgi:hypothetical protein
VLLGCAFSKFRELGGEVIAPGKKSSVAFCSFAIGDSMARREILSSFKVCDGPVGRIHLSSVLSVRYLRLFRKEPSLSYRNFKTIYSRNLIEFSDQIGDFKT